MGMTQSQECVKCSLWQGCLPCFGVGEVTSALLRWRGLWFGKDNSGGLSPMGLRLLLLKVASNPSFCIHISTSCVMGQLSGLWLFPSRGLFLAHMSHMSSQVPSIGKAYMKCQCGRMQYSMDSITLDMRWYKRTGSTSQVFQGWKIRSMSTCLVSSVGITAGNTTLRSLRRRCAQRMLAALCGLGEPSEGTGREVIAPMPCICHY